MGHNDSISPSFLLEMDNVEIEGSNSTPGMEEHTKAVKCVCASLGASWVSGEMTPSPKALLQLPALMKS